ncbi:hypothetical protein PV682_05760 [Streptomyces niveiscabiei]|nr:hypothetical protein [Streptomyces niveiscabiei]MDX3380954.1 hypothetical protein [Streptomyces niveiscabiei]
MACYPSVTWSAWRVRVVAVNRERWLTVACLTVLAVSGGSLVWSIAHGGG